MKRKRIYFDYASTTPTRKEILEAMMPYFSENFGNPSSLHFFGQEALKAIDESREKIKNILKADFLKEIIFTSSATESNNLAIKGLAFYYYFFKKTKPHLITSSIEHPSILEVVADLKEMGIIEVSYLKPEKSGLIDLKKIEMSIQKNTVLITIHYINSELGTIQKISEISKLIQKINRERQTKIYFHIDASQVSFEDLNVKNLNIDLMTLSSHKIYGPKGIALLYLKKGTIITKLISGSEQEYDLRGGTEAVPLIVGFAKALELIDQEREKIKNHLKKIRNYFLDRLKEFSGKILINTDLKNSTYKILNLYFPSKTSQELLIYLDSRGIAVSAGTACKSRANEPSYIVADIYGRERSNRSLRFSFGIYNQKKDVDYLVKCLKTFL